MSVDRAPAWERALVSGVCCYEVGALWTDLPTVTWLARRHPVIAVALVGALAVHFTPEEKLCQILRRSIAETADG